MKETTRIVYKQLDRLLGEMGARYRNAIYRGHIREWLEFTKKYNTEIEKIFAIAKTRAALNKIIETNHEMLKCHDDILRFWGE